MTNFEVTVSPDETILSVKEKCSTHVDNTPAADLKLIYRGKILNNADGCSASKLEEGSTLHLVKSKPAGGNPGQPLNPVPTNNMQQPQTTSTNASQVPDPMAGLGKLHILAHQKLPYKFFWP